MYNILPDLTKEYILNEITQIAIWQKYTKIEKILPNVKYPSPFDENEEEASFVFYQTNNKIKGKDYGGDFSGDCFDFVGKLHYLHCNKKHDFKKILHIIARDFKIHQYKDGNEIIDENVYSSVKFYEKKLKLKMDIQIRPFNSKDTIWSDLRITTDKLKEFNIYACHKIYLNDNIYPIYTYTPNDPAYCYVLDKEEKEYKIYFPLRKKRDKRKPRFITNSKKIQGLNNIKKSKIGIITKSMKDVIVLNNYNLNEEPIQAIAPPAETILITPEQFEYISQFYDEIYSLYDYDPAGLHMAWLLRKVYNIPPLFIKNPTWNSKIKYPIKDFSDYVKHNTDENVNNLITQTQKILKKWKENL